MSFSNPQVHRVTRIAAQAQTFDTSAAPTGQFACIDLTFTQEGGEASMQVFLPISAASYAHRIAAAINKIAPPTAAEAEANCPRIAPVPAAAE